MKLSIFLIFILISGFKSLVHAKNHEGQQSFKDIEKHLKLSKIAPNPKIANCSDLENIYKSIERSLIYNLQDSLIAQDTKGLTQLLMDTKILSFPRIAQSPSRSIDGLEEYKYDNKENLTWSQYFSIFKKIEDVALATEGIYQISADQIKPLNKLKLKIRFDIRGLDQAGQRRNDRGFFELVVTKIEKEWKISGFNVLSGEVIIAKRGPSFENQTTKLGLDKVPRYLRTEAIRRGGYSLSVGDLLSPTQQSIFVGAREGSSVWTKNKDGQFEENKNLPFLNYNLVKTSLFSDFTNSGKQDLILVRFTLDKLQSDLVFFKNEGDGKFSEVKDFILNRYKSFYAMPAAVADFNKDGLLDYYVGFPGAKDFTELNDNSLDRKGKVVQGLFLNKNNYQFMDSSKVSGIDYLHRSDEPQVFAHSALAIDVDEDGFDDIIVVDDRGNAGPVYKNLGDGKFAKMQQNIGLGFNGLGMGVASASINSDGKNDFVMSYVNFAAATRAMNSCGSILERLRGMSGGGLRLFQNNGKGGFFENTQASGLEWAGEGVAGVEFLDFNNDGYPDLFVSNGLWSGTDRKQDVSSIFVSIVSLKESLINMVKSNYREKSILKNLLSNFEGDIATGEFKKGGPRPSMAGYQRKRLFRNNGNGTFTEVGYLEGVDSIADGYMLARLDDKEGRTDLVLRNGDPGTKDYSYPVIEYFKNLHPNKNAITFQIKGNPAKGSNLDAIGTKVTVMTKDGKKQMQQLIANNGTAQSEKILHFGLGELKSADSVEIVFPSGQVQKLKNVAIGHHQITEDK